jgi:prevent-host-death family protein
MSTYTLAEAKAQLSRLFSLAEAGEQITISRRGRAVVKLVPSDPHANKCPV